MTVSDGSNATDSTPTEIHEYRVAIYELAREAESAKIRIECVASDLLALADELDKPVVRISWVARQLRRKAEELAG